MKEFLSRNGVMIGVVVGTIALFVGGIFLFSKNGSSTTSTSKISDEILMPQSAQKTSGIVNNEYLPASASATVNFVEFADYQCPACGLYNPLIKQLMTDYVGKVNFTFRNFPLPQHSNAKISSYAAEAAGLQGKFWQMHDKLFETQNDWANSASAKEIFIGYAKELDLNIDKFTQDLDNKQIKDKVEADYNDGVTVRLTETPTYYINGKKVSFTGRIEDFKTIIDSSL